jgi:hypothetical protein
LREIQSGVAATLCHALQILARIIKRAIDQPIMPKDPPRTAERHQRNFLLLAWLKANSRAGRNIQSHPSGCLPLEYESAIDFEKVIVAADLNRPITRVFNQSSCDATTDVRLDISRSDKVFAWMHCPISFPQIAQIRKSCAIAIDVWRAKLVFT